MTERKRSRGLSTSSSSIVPRGSSRSPDVGAGTSCGVLQGPSGDAAWLMRVDRGESLRVHCWSLRQLRQLVPFAPQVHGVRPRRRADAVAGAKAAVSVATACATDGSTVPMCDAHGYFVSSQSYLDQDATQTLKLPTH